MTATTIQFIPREEWPIFFNRFSRRHEGLRVSVEVLAPETGYRVGARAIPLEGIVADLHIAGSIAIMLGGEPARHMTHFVNAPSHVRLEQIETEDGVYESLQIESTDGATTLVDVHVGAASELSCGIL